MGVKEDRTSGGRSSELNGTSTAGGVSRTGIYEASTAARGSLQQLGLNQLKVDAVLGTVSTNKQMDMGHSVTFGFIQLQNLNDRSIIGG